MAGKVPHKRLLYKLYHHGIRLNKYVQESPRVVYSDHCCSCYSLMTYQRIYSKIICKWQCPLQEYQSAQNVHKSLTWTQHIGQITKRTNSTSASFRHNIHKCPQEIKAQFYITLVRPWLDYASVIWDPQTTENINKLQMVQRRSARMVMTNFRTTSSVSYMIRQLNSPLLQKRRAQARAFMINRVVYQLSMQHL